MKGATRFLLSQSQHGPGLPPPGLHSYDQQIWDQLVDQAHKASAHEFGSENELGLADGTPFLAGADECEQIDHIGVKHVKDLVSVPDFLKVEDWSGRVRLSHLL